MLICEVLGIDIELLENVIVFEVFLGDEVVLFVVLIDVMKIGNDMDKKNVVKFVVVFDFGILDLLKLEFIFLIGKLVKLLFFVKIGFVFLKKL